jgi:hypothetical protein
MTQTTENPMIVRGMLVDDLPVLPEERKLKLVGVGRQGNGTADEISWMVAWWDGTVLHREYFHHDGYGRCQICGSDRGSTGWTPPQASLHSYVWGYDAARDRWAHRLQPTVSR